MALTRLFNLHGDYGNADLIGLLEDSCKAVNVVLAMGTCSVSLYLSIFGTVTEKGSVMNLLELAA